jgi:hypothetical protein
MVSTESFQNTFDGFLLVKPIRDFRFDMDRIEKLFLFSLIINKILEAFLGIKAIDFAVRIILGIIPDVDIKSIGIENHRTLSCHFFKTIGIHPGLVPAYHGVAGCLFGFHNGQRFSVVIIEDIIGITHAGGCGLV